MDKYEYRIKAEQIRKLAEEGDYESAVKIVSTIDWNRVKSIPMLSLVGKIYGKCNQLEESRDIYLIAYDRHPYGRTIIYALAELSIRLGEYIDAVEYYKEFVRVAPRDSGRYILQYKLYEAQDVGIQERIAVLEEFMRHEPVEKWAFELAYLYHRAGMKEKCVEKCDEIVLWFGEGKYVEKAMELKMLYQPLTPEQKEKYDNRNEVEIERSIEAVEKVARMAEEMKDKKQKEEADIHVKTMNIGIYDTVNLQEELKKSMRAILDATEQENIDSAMDSVKKVPEDSRSEKIFDENGETTSITLKLEKEKAERTQAISELLSMNTNELSKFAEDDSADKAAEELPESETASMEQPTEVEAESAELPAAQSSLAEDKLSVLPEEYFVTGDIPSIEEALKKSQPVVETQEDLEKTKEFVLTHRDLGIEDAPTKRIPVEEINQYMNIAGTAQKENDKADAQKQDEIIDTKQEALEDTGNILEKLQGVIPSFSEELLKPMQEGGIEKEPIDTDDDIPTEEFDADNDLLDDFDDFEEDDEDAAAELESRLEAALPEGIKSLVDSDEDESESEEFVSSKNGYLSEELREIFTYFAEMEDVNKQLVHAMEEIELTPSVGNVAIMGAAETGKTTLAVDIVKAVQRSHKFKGKKIAKITGLSLNNREVADIMKSVAGGVLMIEKAGKLSEATMEALAEAFAKESKNMIVIIEDTKENVEALFKKCPDFAAMFTARIELPEYTNDDLVAFAKSYAREQGYAIDDVAILALYSVLDEMQVDNHVPTLTEVMEVMDDAIKSAGKKNFRNMIDSIFSKRYDEEHYIYIRERDFE